MQGQRILAFVKYGTEEHMKELQEGKLFFNTLQYFAGCDASIGRGDEFENVYKQTIGPSAVMDFTSELHHVDIKMIRLANGDYISRYVNTEFYANLFCLYTVVSEKDLEDQQCSLSKEMIGFGSHMLMIINPHEFLKRVRESIEPHVKNLHISPVTYINIKTLNGRKDYFKKPLRYSYQKEYRIAYQNEKEQVSFYNICSIEDISVLMPADKCKSIRFFKKQDDLLQNMQSIFDRHLEEYETKFETLEKYAQLSYAEPAKIQDLENDLIQSQNRMLEFLKMIKHKDK